MGYLSRRIAREFSRAVRLFRLTEKWRIYAEKENWVKCNLSKVPADLVISLSTCHKNLRLYHVEGVQALMGLTRNTAYTVLQRAQAERLGRELVASQEGVEAYLVGARRALDEVNR